MSKSRSQLIEYLKEIDITNKVVLDAGCGPKDKWARNFTKGEPKEYKTLDINITFGVDHAIDLNQLLKYSETYKQLLARIDIVFCLETLEHLYNPYMAIKNMYDFLKINGKAYFSTPWINPYHDTVDYARYTDEWYQKVLTDLEFKNIKIKPRVATDGFPHLINFYKAEGLRMSKIRRGQEDKLAHIGYFVEAIK